MSSSVGISIKGSLESLGCLEAVVVEGFGNKFLLVVIDWRWFVLLSPVARSLFVFINTFR